jgi:hypothetical protein
LSGGGCCCCWRGNEFAHSSALLDPAAPGYNPSTLFDTMARVLP